MVINLEHLTLRMRGIKVFKITQIKGDGTIDISNCDFIDTSRLESFRKFVINKGDILMALSGATIGKISRFKSNEVVLQNYRVGNYIPLDENILCKDYFYYFLTTEYTHQQILANLTQSAQENVGKEDIHKMLLFLPPLPEQKSIAEILSSLDDKIDLLHRQNKTLEQLAETLFSQWFVEEAEEGWEKDALGNLFEIKIGRTPPRKEHQWFTENPTDVKWISIKDLGNSGIYIVAVSEYLTKEAVERFSIPVIPTNTVLLSFKLTVGRVAITTEEMLSNEAIAHFKIINGSKLFPEFLYLFLKSFNYESLGSTSSIADAVNSQMIKEIEISIPDEGKLKGFRNGVEPMFQKIKSNTNQIRTLTQLRDTLLPKLMSGEVRVSEL
jgi:type I restriction enzyme S subunit